MRLGLRRPLLRRRLGNRLRRCGVGRRRRRGCGRLRLGGGLLGAAGDLAVEPGQHVGGLGLHHRQQLEPGRFELGELGAIGLSLFGRASQLIDLDDEVFGLLVELAGAVIAHGAERLLLVPTLLFFELLEFGLQLRQRLAIEGAQLRAGLVDGGGELIGRAGGGIGAARRENQSQGGQQA